MLRSELEHGVVPWRNAGISGFIVDPDRKKMSKSKGNVVVPTDVLEQFGSDAVRYWAASAKLGADTAYEVNQMKIGRRLAIKLLNASKFVLNLGVTEASIGEGSLDRVSNALDLSLLAQLRAVTEQATAAFEKYDHARALQLTESFFWTFTDDYVELVKDRAYGDAEDAATQSVQTTLATTLDALLRLFAPFLPFATEEVWSWWRNGSVHHAAWPGADALSALPGTADTEVLTSVALALGGIRKAKSEAKVKQRTEVETAVITASTTQVEQVRAGLSDLLAAGNAKDLRFAEGDGTLAVSDVELVPQPAE